MQIADLMLERILFLTLQMENNLCTHISVSILQTLHASNLTLSARSAICFFRSLTSLFNVRSLFNMPSTSGSTHCFLDLC